METTNLSLSGTPGFWAFLFVHPYISFFAFCCLCICVFGTLTDVLVAFAKRHRNG
jgi:hypothetical protein